MIVAKLALYGWPLVILALYNNLRPARSVIVAVVAGYLLLPEQGGTDLPLLPAYNKFFLLGAAPLLLALAIGLGRDRDDVCPGIWPRHPLILGLIVLLFLSAAVTVMTNRSPIFFPGLVLPGLQIYDIFSDSLTLLVMLAPVLLGRKYLSDSASHALLLKVVAIAAGLYAFLALYEVRMSPQLSNMIYGFFPHAWIQHLRAGGWRPIVFLPHGLFLGVFFGLGVLAAAVVSRIGRPDQRMLYLGLTAWIFLTLFLSKTLAAFFITAALLPVALLLKPRLQMLLAALCVGVVLLYPMLRTLDLVPTDRIVSRFQSVDLERAGSLAFRFENEDLLLDKAMQKPLAGWGKWGRSRVFDEAGNDIAVTDGIWVIQFGLGGWSRYLAYFGILCAPMLLLGFRRGRDPPSPATAGLCLLLALNLLDLLPNAGLSGLTLLIVGALVGRLERAAESTAAPAAAPAADPRGLRYARDPGGAPPARPDPADTAYSRQTRRHVRQRRERRRGGRAHVD